MKLKDLLHACDLQVPRNEGAVEVESLVYDSRLARKGSLFVALPGEHVDGTDFCGEAVRRGACAVLSERPPLPGVRVPWIRVPSARRSLSALAAVIYGHPSTGMEIVGITGTNGKTTTAALCRALWRGAGRRPGLIGTVQYEIGDRVIPAARTTPEAPELHSMLADMLHGGCRSAIIEVSSHAICQQRVETVDFDVVVFTNLSQDHLDYHGGMEEYFEAKAALFDGRVEGARDARAVINADDPRGRRLRGRVQRERVISYGIESRDCDVRLRDIEMKSNMSRALVSGRWGEGELVFGLPGRFNLYNALAALTAALSSGMDLARALAVIREPLSVPGRLERFAAPGRPAVYVDYAHTPDALRNVLRTLREISGGRIITVFGCGGERDRGKRPLMGEAVAQGSDMAVLTNDNPRGEDPGKITEEIMAGMKNGAPVETILDRREAIAAAIRKAGERDVVLVAGKGHERMQEFRHATVPFDDRRVVMELLDYPPEK